jgi:uncharacterized RDD family membrane protein YckC
VTLNARRILARLIDALLIFGATVLLAGSLGWSGLTWGVATLWGFVAYFFLCEAISGQTVGKAAMGLRVARRGGGAPSISSVATRNVIRVFEEPFIALIALFASGWRHQRLGDMAARTTVRQAEYGKAPEPSGLIAVYPAIWALTAVLFIGVVGSPSGSKFPQTSGSRFPQSTIVDPEYAAAADYLRELKQICRQHDREIAANGHRAIPLARILRHETSFTAQVAAVEAPNSMLPTRTRILHARGQVERITLVAIKRMRNSPHPQALYNREIQPRVIRLVTASYHSFGSAGINCDAAD